MTIKKKKKLIIIISLQVKDFLLKNGIPTLDWPGNSPDLNPIENLWHVMGMKINKKMPSSSKKLNSIIEEVWYKELTIEYLQDLIDSMPIRIAAVIANKGGATKY